MSTWPRDELRKIAAADGLHISPLGADKATYGTPTIWSVAVDGARYVRGYHVVAANRGLRTHGTRPWT
jgi:hypothetical protein